jgi:NAD(P)H-quinone oxidoreductase subunit 4
MLSLLISLPLLGAAAIGFWPGQLSGQACRWATLALAGGLLLLTGGVMVQFDLSNPGLQLSESVPWIRSLGLNYVLGVDGLSLPLVALANFLVLVVVFGGDIGIPKTSPRLFYVLTLLVAAGITGSLLSQNLLLFIIFYELVMIPLYLLILIWGGKNREGAAMKFLIYTAVSGILILAGFLALTWVSGAESFDYAAIKTDGLSAKTQLILLTVLLVGFGIKIPLVPLHSWLPDAYVEASTPVAILLGGILAKLGTYGLVRFCLGLFPQTWTLVAPTLSIIATVGVLYGAMAAISQKDIKRMVAYSSIGHMSYVLLGVAAHTSLSMVGAISQMVSHGLILALLFYLVGVIEVKVGTRELEVLNGLLNPLRGLPSTSSLLVLAGMASAGIPGLVGFISEFLVFQGSYSVFPVQTLLCVVGTGLTAVYFVILLNRTCFGKLDNNTAYYPKVTRNEQLPALVLTAIVFWLGIQPSWLVRWSESTSAAIVATVSESVPRSLTFDYTAPVLTAPTLETPV